MCSSSYHRHNANENGRRILRKCWQKASTRRMKTATCAAAAGQTHRIFSGAVTAKRQRVSRGEGGEH
ncbi:hypothetical protein E2C01_025572 [Portunus trituberculatus]|uniref:Uncharacterized protein n=1 Tax=Portunus trituberculatus TaxID=210409 RepID=A0A5B7EIA6_PORTR|nr:hypothetical protein [Portunus trituberculatus]